MKVCLKFNRRFINSISFILSIIIVLIFSFGIENLKNSFNEKEKIEVKSNQNTVIKEKKNEEKKSEQKNGEEVNQINEDVFQKEEYDWYIEIPEIELYAPIEEGTDDETLNRAVGHFDMTSRRGGNCGLLAYNNGYEVNYFSRLKELKKGDIVYYFVDDRKYKYKITDILIIYETDWSMLEETEDDKLTLITSVENRDEYRLCVQGDLVDE